MRKFGWALLLFVCALAPLRELQASQALVVLVQDQTENSDERSVVERFTSMMVRNATHGKYDSTSYLRDDLANKFTLIRTISQAARAGYDVDVLVLTAGDDDSIFLRAGDIQAHELVESLKGLKDLKQGGLRFVYTTGGHHLVSAWRELGAQAVLSQVVVCANGACAPNNGMNGFFFPRFIKRWGEGATVSEAAVAGIESSAQLVKAFSPFVAQSVMDANGGLISPAPVFEGLDLNIRGKSRAHPASLNAIVWPDTNEKREAFAHTPLREGVLTSIVKLVTNRFEVSTDLVPGVADLVSQIGEPVWQMAYDTFPGRTTDELVLPGTDVRIILSRVIPGIDKYLQTLIDNLETMVVTRRNGRLVADVWLTDSKGMRFDLQKESDSKTGQAYAVKVKSHIHFEIFSKRDSITIDSVKGVTVMVKLPVVPDGVVPTKLYLDTGSETLTVSAKAVSGIVKVVGKADIRARKFTGIDWGATLFKNAPLILGILLFSPL